MNPPQLAVVRRIAAIGRGLAVPAGVSIPPGEDTAAFTAQALKAGAVQVTADRPEDLAQVARLRGNRLGAVGNGVRAAERDAIAGRCRQREARRADGAARKTKLVADRLPPEGDRKSVV